VLYVIYGAQNSGKIELRSTRRNRLKAHYMNFKLSSVITYEDVVEALMEELKLKEVITELNERELTLTKWARVGLTGAFNYWIWRVRREGPYSGVRQHREA